MQPVGRLLVHFTARRVQRHHLQPISNISDIFDDDDDDDDDFIESLSGA